MKTKDLVLIALFAAIIIVLGFIPPITLGFIPVPITAQTLGVMLAGCILGAKRGALACVLVIILVAAGLPVLSGGRGGYAWLIAPTSGFLFGWVAAAFATGYIAERFVSRDGSTWQQLSGFFIAAVVGGVAVLYLIGVPWVSVVAGIPFSKALAGSMAFVPGDLIKAAVAAFAARAAYVGYPLLPARS